MTDSPATSWEEMKEKFISAFKNPTSQKYYDVQKLFDKYVDSNSCKRITEVLFNDKEAEKYKIREWVF